MKILNELDNRALAKTSYHDASTIFHSAIRSTPSESGAARGQRHYRSPEATSGRQATTGQLESVGNLERPPVIRRSWLAVSYEELSHFCPPIMNKSRSDLVKAALIKYIAAKKLRDQERSAPGNRVSGWIWTGVAVLIGLALFIAWKLQ